MPAKKSGEPASGVSSSRRGGGGKRRSPDEQTAGASLRVDVPTVQTAEEWQRTFDAVPDPIAILDTQHRIVRVNKAMAERLGLIEDQCVGQTCYRLVHGTDEPPAFCPHARLLRDGEEHTVEVHEERLAGDFLVTASPLRDSSGRLVGSVHVARDLTDRKRAEEELRQSESRLKAIFRAAPTGIGLVCNRVIREANDRLCEMVGYSREELLDEPVRMLYPSDEDYEYVGREKCAQIRQRGTGTVETHLRRKDGTVIDVLLSSSPLDPDDLAIGVTFTALDITDRKRAEEALCESESCYRSLYLAVREGVCLHEVVYAESGKAVDYRILDVNPAYEAITGLSREKTIGALASELYGTGSAPFLDVYAEVAETGKPARFDVYWEPMRKHFRIAAFSPGPRRFATVFTDVTEAKRAEQSLRDSEERFRVLFEDAPDPIYLNDLEGMFIDGNRAAEEITGYRKEELVGKNLMTAGLLVPSDSPKAAERLAGNAAGRPTGPDEFTLIRKDGGRVSVEIRTFRVKIGAQDVVLGIARDVTERKRAEEALRESQQRFRDLAELLPQTVFETDLQGRLTFVNREALKTFGFSEEESRTSINALDMLAPHERDRGRRNIEQVLRGEPSRGNEYLARRKDGSLFPVVISSAPIVRNGRPAGLRGIIVDITERKRAEEAQKLAATGRMAARVAHEINNPLAGIKNSFLLLKDAVPRDHPDYDLVGRIEKEIDRIANIVRQMYRLHSPDQEPPHAICVGETIREVVLMLQPSWREYDVRVDVNAPSPALSARIPEGSLRQVLYNLVENAIEASPQGGVVKIHAVRTEENIKISISDEGVGIPRELQERVFEPFFSTKRGPGTCGMGLGLSIVRDIVDTLRGTITLQSTPSRGTTFDVVLPV
ncbi:MAG TPA: PAS domain S-box protein [Thermoguttaceae bacterium]|nr:PAS domain S-box protein [Thermoguttaceae bacterium]